MKYSTWILLMLVTACTTTEASFATSALGGDSDSDGDPDSTDCAPLDPTIHSGAVEACNEVDDDCDGDVDEPVGSSYCVPVGTEATLEEQCSGNLMVGRLGQGRTDCPEPNGEWTMRPLFTQTMSGPGNYCVYEHAGEPQFDGLPSSPDGHPWHDWLDPDCFVVAPQAPDDELAALALWEDYSEGLAIQAGGVAALPAISAGSGSYPVTTHVAIVDTEEGYAPHHGPTAPVRHAVNSDHGALIGLLIEQLACPQGRLGGPCPIDFTNHLALPALGDGSYVADGGAIGAFSHVATAIEDATAARAARGGHLLINLSIGADPRYATTSSGTMRSSVEALKIAIENAVCDEDALVFAAAGNATGGPTPSADPVIPAAWASETTRCGRPYVVAVGGVDPEDGLIRATRDNAVAELVAPARSAVVDLTDGHGSVRRPTAFMTGTSIGTAVATATAAVLWSYADHLSPNDVETSLYDASTPLPHLTANLCRGTSCRGVRRVSLCDAASAGLDELCAYDPTACTAPLPCFTIAAGGGSAVVPTSASMASLPMPSTTVSAIGLFSDVVESPSCTATIQADASSLPPQPDLCPFEQYTTPGASPLGVSSQPDTPPCRVCGYDTKAKSLRMYLNGALTGTIYPPVLETSSGGRYYLSSVMSGSLTPSLGYEVSSLSLGGVTSATLAFPYIDSSGKKMVLRSEIEMW